MQGDLGGQRAADHVRTGRDAWVVVLRPGVWVAVWAVVSHQAGDGASGVGGPEQAGGREFLRSRTTPKGGVVGRRDKIQLSHGFMT